MMMSLLYYLRDSLGVLCLYMTNILESCKFKNTMSLLVESIIDLVHYTELWYRS
jgi:hypothetical protein